MKFSKYKELVELKHHPSENENSLLVEPEGRKNMTSKMQAAN